MKIVIHQFPASCSRVTMTALEEIGLDYEERCVNIRIAQQKSADYLAMNPKGKVPTVIVDGTVMTENAAILAFLDARFPQAKLLPRTGDPVIDNRGLIDLIWVASTIHPIVRQVRMPIKLTTGDPSGVKADGMAKMADECDRLAARIGDRWWYGNDWSILDTYLYWAYSTAELGGFSLADYPVLVAHAERVRARPSFQRVLARETAMVEREAIPDVKL